MDDGSPQMSAATIGGLDVHWHAWGDPSAPLAVLLHGFPDTTYTWRHLGPALAEAGFHAVAPSLRGYAPTGLAPEGSYRLGTLAADAAALADHFGAADPVLIGHDWGAIIGYTAVGWQPDRWKRLVTMAVPPLGSVMAGFLSYRHIRRSWYMFVFQHPLAPGVVMAEDLAFLAELWKDWSPGYDATADVAHVRDALRDPGRVEAALGYYKAMLGDAFEVDGVSEADSAAFLPSPVPTLYLHGTTDGCMSVELAEDATAYLPTEGSKVEVLEGVGHFLHLEAPAEVNAKIVAFLTT